jgi:zinc protease
MKQLNFVKTLVFLLIPLLAAGQAKLVERVEKKGNQLVIPYEKYVLPNGLTLIIHEDHSDPVVHVDVTYHVGSAREEIGKSGFAHFFEHMMFQGSDNVADEQHFKIITEAGGTLNGTTNRDRTNYFETVPNNQVEKILWLEADRMGFLLDAVTQRKFEIQRETVKNERGQNYDNRPYGLVGEVVSKNLYPYGHPYSWLTIGYIEDLNRVNVDDLKNFFLRWYGPNNATLTVGGDVKPAEIVKMVEKYFGSIPRGPEVKNMSIPAPVLEGNRYVTLVDNYARLPQLSITMPTVPNYHEDEAALSALAQILGQGKNSIFYQNIIKDQKALNAIAFNRGSELSGEFSISLTPTPGTSLSESKKLIDQAIKSFEERGVSDDDIAKFIGSFESQYINRLQSVSGKVSQLASYQTFTGNPNMIAKELERYTRVTKEEVMRVYEKYIKDKPAVVVSVVPKGQESNIVAVDNYSIDESGYKAPDYGYAGLKYVKPKDNFDRSKMPGSGPNPVVKIPVYWKKNLDNGIKVIGTENKEVPIVTLSFSMPGGHLLMANDTSKIGLPNMFAAMMNEGTKNYSAEEMQAELQKLGSSVSVSSGLDNITFRIQTLKKNLDKTLALLEERMFNTVFSEDDFSRIQRQVLESFKQRDSQPATIASDVFDILNYGKDHILAMSQSGTAYTVNNLSLTDVENYYKNYITAKNAELVIVGDITQKEIMDKLTFLSKLPGKEIILPAVAVKSNIDKTRIYLVDVPRAAQTQFRVGGVTGLKYDVTGEYYKATLMNYVLGGAFNSRINLNLREDKGYTYGARSGFSGNKYTGTFAFSSGIRQDATDSALVEVMNELSTYAQSGITKEELQFMKSALGQSDARAYETGFQKASFIGRILSYDLPGNFVEEQNKILKNINEAEIDKLAAKWINTDKMNILLVGDKSKILPGLERFNYEIIELDAKGNVKGPLTKSNMSETINRQK